MCGPPPAFGAVINESGVTELPSKLPVATFTPPRKFWPYAMNTCDVVSVLPSLAGVGGWPALFGGDSGHLILNIHTNCHLGEKAGPCPESQISVGHGPVLEQREDRREPYNRTVLARPRSCGTFSMAADPGPDVRETHR